MKKKQIELDFIGGLGSLSKPEELALTKYFSMKKAEKLKSLESKKTVKKRQEVKQ